MTIPETTPELNSWDDLNCDTNLLRGIYAYGFEQPSSIQKRAIPAMLKKNDIIAQAQSGTGKTGAFTIGTLGQIDASKKDYTRYYIITHKRVIKTNF